MSDVKYRIQQTNKKTRDRVVVGALFVNDRSPIDGALNIVLDRPQGNDPKTGKPFERPTRLVLDFENNFYDVLPPLAKKGPAPRTPSEGDDSL